MVSQVNDFFFLFFFYLIFNSILKVKISKKILNTEYFDHISVISEEQSETFDNKLNSNNRTKANHVQTNICYDLAKSFSKFTSNDNIFQADNQNSTDCHMKKFSIYKTKFSHYLKLKKLFKTESGKFIYSS